MPPAVDDTSLKGAAFERERQERRARRVARYEQVVALHRAGYPIKQIARTLVIDRRTVRAWLAAGWIVLPGLFSPTVDSAEFGRRFHGHDERVDVESLGLTVELWRRVVTDLMT